MYAIFKDQILEQAREVYSSHSSFQLQQISLEELRNHQHSKIREVIGYAKQNSSFYKEHLRDFSYEYIKKLPLNKIEQIPFTTKADLRKNGMKLISTPIENSWVYYETTGTTGKPTPCPRNEIDSIFNNTPLIINYRDIFNSCGKKHIVGIMGPSELHSTGDTFEDVMRSLEHTSVKMWPRSPVVGFKRVFELINDLQITALICTPAVAISVARYFKKVGLNPSNTSVRLILTVGELITPALLSNIGRFWGAKAYNCMYASQEASIMGVCAADNNLYTVPLNNYYEIINPTSGEKYDITKSVTGELVITHLYKGAKPLIRYRTGDLVRSTFMPNGSQKITPIGRVKDTLYLNNKLCYAWDIEQSLLSDLPSCLDYAIQITKNEKSGLDTLNITVEMFSENVDFTLEIENSKKQLLIKYPGISVDIEIGKTNNITSTSAMVSWKAARIYDLRIAADNSERDVAFKLINGGFDNEPK